MKQKIDRFNIYKSFKFKKKYSLDIYKWIQLKKIDSFNIYKSIQLQKKKTFLVLIFINQFN